MTPLEEFDAAIAKITQERGSTYGHPAEDFRRAREMYQAVLLECRDHLLAHPMMMICVKLARLIETPEHIDSWIDIAGYARTAAMILDRRQQDSPVSPSRLMLPISYYTQLEGEEWRTWYGPLVTTEDLENAERLTPRTIDLKGWEVHSIQLAGGLRWDVINGWNNANN